MHWLTAGRLKLYRRLLSRYLPYAASSCFSNNPDFLPALQGWKIAPAKKNIDLYLLVDDAGGLTDALGRLSENSLIMLDFTRSSFNLEAILAELEEAGLLVEVWLHAGFFVRCLSWPLRLLGFQVNPGRVRPWNSLFYALYILELRLHPYVKFITGENTILIARKSAGEPRVSCDLSVVIPAYNEERRLPPVLTEIISYLEKNRLRSEVLVIDDGSSDGTAMLGGPGVRVISLYRNFGKGGAAQEGVRQAAGEFILITDADGSTPFVEYEKLKKPIEQGYDLAIGSRYLAESNVAIKQSAARILLSRTGNLLIRLFTGLNFRDTQCGFKLFRHSAARVLFRHLVNLRYGFDFEILKYARDLGLQTAEIAVRWEDRAGSKIKGRDSFSVLLDLFRLRFGYLYRFSFVGVLNTLIDYSIHNLLIYFFGMGDEVRQVLYQGAGFIAANFISYIFNSGITFQARGQYWKFFVISLVALILSSLSFYGLNHKFNPEADYWLVNTLKLSTVVVSFITNYFGYKLLVFRVR